MPLVLLSSYGIKVKYEYKESMQQEKRSKVTRLKLRYVFAAFAVTWKVREKNRRTRMVCRTMKLPHRRGAAGKCTRMTQARRPTVHATRTTRGACRRSGCMMREGMLFLAAQVSLSPPLCVAFPPAHDASLRLVSLNTIDGFLRFYDRTIQAGPFDFRNDIACRSPLFYLALNNFTSSTNCFY